jgi:hypothetical protein
VEERQTTQPRLTRTSGPRVPEIALKLVTGDFVAAVEGPARVVLTKAQSLPARGNISPSECSQRRRRLSASHGVAKDGIQRPFLTVRSKIPSVARSADSGTIGKRSLRSPPTLDQS